MLGALGFNRVKLRWTLRRWGNAWRRARRRHEQRVAHVRYQHKTCPACHAVNDRDARACASCGHALPARGWQVLERVGVSTPSVLSLSGLLGLLCVIVYARLVVASGGGGVVSLPWQVLYEHGGHYPPAVAGGDWWRLATAVFMHAGLWHIGFNLFALAVVGPHVERRYGGLTMVLLFLVTGVLANLGSGAMGLRGVGIGASGGIMGLIGAAAAAGHRDGTSIGRQLRNDMLKWTAYVMLFGLLIGADNWAHAFGFAAGGLFGLTVDPAWLGPGARLRPLVLVAGLAALVAAAAATYAIVRPPASVFERRLAAEIEAELRPTVAPLAARCARPGTAAAPDCAGLERQRRQCSHPLDDFLPPDITPEGRVYYAVL